MAVRPSRRRFLADGGKAALALAAWRAPRVEAAPAFDVVIHGGTVLDGTGAAAFPADLGVVGDTIAALGAIPPEQGRRALDARDCTSCPASSTSTRTRTSACPPIRRPRAACARA